MTRRRILILLAATALAGSGCNRQDADGLARIGNLLMKRAQSLKQKSTTNTPLERALPALGVPDSGSDVDRSGEDRGGS